MAASALSRFCRLAATVVSLIQVMQGVRITPRYQEIETNETETEVILPCFYTTESDDSPQIEWHLHNPDEEEPVMRVGSDGKITAGKNFTTRVQRGESASLILRAPKQKDSGKYDCEVFITEDLPMYDKISVKLIVKEDVCPKRNPSGERMSNVPLKSGPVTMLVFDWLVPIGSLAFMLGSLFRINKSYTGKFISAPRTLNIFYVIRTLASILAMSLCFVSMVCLLFFASSGGLTDPSVSFGTAAYTSGGVGIFMFAAIVIGNYIFKKMYHLRNESVNGINRSTEAECANQLIPTTTHEFGIIDKTIPTNECRINLIKLDPVIRKMDKPSSFKVNSMCLGSNNKLYICTDKKVYCKDTSEDYIPMNLGVNNEELFMATLDRMELIISIRSKSKNEMCKLMFYNIETNESDTLTLEFSSYCPWVCVGRDSQLYVTDYDNGKLHRLSRFGKSREQMGEGVLRNPTCAAQNTKGQVIVTDSEKNDVYVFEQGGSFLHSLYLALPEEVVDNWKGPHRVVLDSNDKMFVACAYSPTIFMFSEAFRYIGMFHTGGESGGNPWSLVMIENKTMYVAHDDCIRIYSDE